MHTRVSPSLQVGGNTQGHVDMLPAIAEFASSDHAVPRWLSECVVGLVAGFERFQHVWSGQEVRLTMHHTAALCCACCAVGCIRQGVHAGLWSCSPACGCTVPSLHCSCVGRHSSHLWILAQIITHLAEAGLGQDQVEFLWTCCEEARKNEDKAQFTTGTRKCHIVIITFAALRLL